MDKIIKGLQLALLIFAMNTNAQEFPMTPAIWSVEGAGSVFENYKGKRALYLYRSRASLKPELDFITGILEYDIFITDRRGFPGIQFRIEDAANFEEFYVRPHQSGNPDANQYTPVFNGIAGWQIYYGKGHAAPVNYRMNEWNHVKLVIAETDAEVYINDMNVPALYIPELKRKPRSGTIRFNGGGPSPFHVADLKVTKVSNPVLVSSRLQAPSVKENVVKKWSVSNSFPEGKLDKLFELSRSLKSGLKWEEVVSESAGYANLARVAVRDNQNNTTFAKVTINSDRKQVVKMSYGFSDRAIIYLNDQILAGGHDEFTSRDYRFLGTMGYFDDIYLSLEKGKNELWIAVSENFGGWGIMAKFDTMKGIRLD